MTRELFTQWLLQLDDTKKKKQRKVLVIVDNCSAHMANVQLSNMQLEFIPANCTFLLQPLDQDIIRCVKTEFWKRSAAPSHQHMTKAARVMVEHQGQHH